MVPSGMRLGIDLGGTKMEAVVLDGLNSILARHRITMPPVYRDALEAIGSLVAEVERQAGAKVPAIGIGTPGSFSSVSGLLRNAKNTPLDNRPIAADLTDLLQRQVHIGNDANCFALAEALLGAGREHDIVFGAIIGTGVGGRLVAYGKPILGRNNIGGEWGHNPLQVDGIDPASVPRCNCGRLGCVEAWCSGPGLAADHFRRTGSEMDTEMLAAFADAGDFEAKETLDLHLVRLGKALAGIVNLLDPDVIVLGGGLSKMQHLYTGLPEAMRAHVFSPTFDTPIVQNALGDSAGVIGAAWLSPNA